MDPYLYPDTMVLRNLRGLRNQKKLDRFEQRKTKPALENLRDNPVEGNFDFAHLCDIHRRIFEEVYPFAGEPRVIGIRKWEPVLNGSSVEYSGPQDILPEATAHLAAMNARDWSGLDDMSQPEKMEIFAKDVAELWRIHPFREGNTRSTMTFATQYAREHDFALDTNIFASNPR